jgi:hypothetical protein
MNDTIRRSEVVLSSKMKLDLVDYPIADIDRDAEFQRIFDAARPYTMTGKDVMYALYDAVRHIVRNNIPGDIVECGVWRGGSALVAALTLRAMRAERNLWLYDTFEGMTAPTELDVDREGHRASDYMERYSDDGKWCYADLADVRRTFRLNGFGEAGLRFIRGDVLQTLPNVSPDRISVLRLDTDWYQSTKLELELLYPKLSPGGVLIIDDYGYWEGSRRAVDEYFAQGPAPMLVRINDQVRLAIKA